MKLFRSALLLSSLFSLSLMGQRGGGGGGGFHGGGGGGFHGGGGFSGGGYRGGGYGGGGYRGGYGGYGGYRGGYGGYGGYRGWGYGGWGYGGWGYGGWGLGLGWGYPYYWGGYSYPYYDPYYYDPSYYDPAPATYTYAPAARITTTVSSGSYYREADYYLIAFTDHNIRAALSYQVLGGQIEWEPKEGGPVQRAPLSSVDKRFSAQINRDRRVKFELP